MPRYVVGDGCASSIAWHEPVLCICSYVLFTCFGEGPALAEIASMIETGSVRPVIDSVFRLDQTVAAFEASKAGRAKGKIVVQVQ